MTLLSVNDLSVQRGNRTTLNKVSFSAEGGELIGIVGPNGSGKSTLLKAILGLLPHSGMAMVEGKHVSAFSLNERARRMAYLPQNREVAWGVTVKDLVALGRAPYSQAFGASNAAEMIKVEAALRSMEVTHLRESSATQISGGELARVLTARALAQETPLLFADEPNAGLDPAHQIHLMSILQRVASEGQTILVSLHDLNLAARWCSRLLVISEGTLVADGAPQETLGEQVLRDVFGIEAFRGEDAQGTVIVPVRRVT
ncbi:ABC transporter ATP-binding protein [Pseudovibrio sp. SPO723]|uniref:ABC transporter ATP-binding protein n=1 Tax=Nesiotobacter zosterae TaxID=392721 RepID=UPI0029C11B3D|nr:ABC transporter ATP-binding protein [Pseudovibrio sp. SPO723]MDX5591940.1 ABC transporter ATP-binding protein [Pseudovibrio sp. SPO723]